MSKADKRGPPVSPGEVLYLLTYRGEGWTKAWLRGRLVEEADIGVFIGMRQCEPIGPDCPADLVEKPETTWWVQIRNASGEVGWTRETDKFDGKDALGR